MSATMPTSLIGRKCGMTRIFTEEGHSVPVTVIHVLPNRVSQIKTVDNDGYTALQVTMGSQKANRLTRPVAGHYKKASVEPGLGLWELEMPRDANMEEFQVGQELTVSLFKVGQKVDVTGTSKGKGFAGTVKRHNFATQDFTHGNSRSHRVPGSTGQNQTPGRVFKGKKMAGHMGNERVTVQLLDIVEIDNERGLVFVKGGIPGAPGGHVILRSSKKSKV